MGLDKEELADKLRRAYEMEETMAGRLIELCHPQIGLSGIADSAAQQISKMLGSMREDTLKHKNMVLEVLSGLSK